jgi:glutamyl-tRNA synthetase
LPLLLNPDRTKLSKRQGDVAVEDYKNKGYAHDALVNFVALLGWNPSADREIYEMEELIEVFNLEKVNKAGAVFDIQKLDWMNGEYFRKQEPSVVAKEMMPIVREHGYEDASEEYVAEVFVLLRERLSNVKQILPFADYMFEDPKEFEQEYKEKFWDDTIAPIMPALIEKFEGIPADSFNNESLKPAVKEFCKENGKLKMGKVMNPLRLMVTGKSVGAGIMETLELLGKDIVVRRMKAFMELHG